jgi:hypothetical protein
VSKGYQTGNAPYRRHGMNIAEAGGAGKRLGLRVPSDGDTLKEAALNE